MSATNLRLVATVWVVDDLQVAVPIKSFSGNMKPWSTTLESLHMNIQQLYHN